jgi:hypothetical protein
MKTGGAVRAPGSSGAPPPPPLALVPPTPLSPAASCEPPPPRARPTSPPPRRPYVRPASNFQDVGPCESPPTTTAAAATRAQPAAAAEAAAAAREAVAARHLHTNGLYVQSLRGCPLGRLGRGMGGRAETSHRRRAAPPTHSRPTAPGTHPNRPPTTEGFPAARSIARRAGGRAARRGMRAREGGGGGRLCARRPRVAELDCGTGRVGRRGGGHGRSEPRRLPSTAPAAHILLLLLLGAWWRHGMSLLG